MNKQNGIDYTDLLGMDIKSMHPTGKCIYSVIDIERLVPGERTNERILECWVVIKDTNGRKRRFTVRELLTNYDQV